MDAYMQKTLLPYQHLRIQLEEIISATNNFDDQKNYIGGGGFGKVYKGEVSHSKGRSMVAIKRLDPTRGQGIPEFLKEITMLSDCMHENVISLLGFCDEGHEMILVYEHASQGSLDRHLYAPHLTWVQRLKICLDVAKGLRYLHDPKETHQRLIHCDLKSGNILLDDQLNAKVSNFGLSIMGPANEQRSMIVTLAAGTRGYCDPQYAITHTLTKESDVYSFGVVLFEVFCGRLCYTSSNGGVSQILVPTWIESYRQKKLNDIIFKNPTIQRLDQSALEIFSDIAYWCLKESREDRPKMDEVVTELQTALDTQQLLESQEFSEWKARISYYEEINKSAEPPLNYSSEVEFRNLLYKGVLINGGKTYFSLNKKGEHCEMICLAERLDSDTSELEYNRFHPTVYNSRFAMGVFVSEHGKFKTRVKTQFLSLGITYTVNLVFKFMPQEKVRRCASIDLRYKLQGETENLHSYLACERDDGWWTCELYQLTSDQTIVDLEILFHGYVNCYDTSFIAIEGIEFRPLEKEDEKMDMQPISDSDADWEEKLPDDYEDIMRWSTNRVQWTTKKEAYLILRKGFLIYPGDHKKWFSLDKNRKKCCMISTVFSTSGEIQMSLPESRFEKVIVCETSKINLRDSILSHLVSPQTTYAIYLVYKFLEDQDEPERGAPMDVRKTLEAQSLHNHWYIYLENPQTPVIRPKIYQNTHNLTSRPKLKGLPLQRNDGWMEVQVSEFQTAATPKGSYMALELKSLGHKFSKIIVEGVEFRPI